MKLLRWCRTNWFRLFRWFNGIAMWIAIFAFIAWWWIPWAIYVTLGVFFWLALVLFATAIPYMLSVKCKYNLPRWLEFLPFEAYRWRMGQLNNGMPPLIAYPFALFREIEFPSVFWEKGLLEAVKLTEEWPDDFQGRFNNFTDGLLAMKGDEEAIKRVDQRRKQENQELAAKIEAKAKQIHAEKLENEG
jgi:hypothetical protein